MTHLARADEEDGIKEQVAAFDAACKGLPYPRSIANSAGIVRFAEVGGDIVRPGIMLYGATPFPYDTAEMIGVQPVMTLRSQIIAVQDLKANDSVGYGAAYTASRAHRIGMVACGYADGYPRHAPNGTPVLVCGKKVRMAGRPSMDMLTVDLTDVPEARIGSPVVLWGEGLPVDDVASAAATVGYELLCALAPRVPIVDDQRRAHRSRACSEANPDMYTVVTGAAGFIGANLVRALNPRGETSILAVDNCPTATSSRTSSTARSPNISTRTSSSRASRMATSTTTSPPSSTRAPARTRWRPTAGT